MIKCYKTEVDNLYLFISHKKNGAVNCTYGYVSNDMQSMVEFDPEYGPLTRLKCNTNIIDEYLNNNVDQRGNWSQLGYEDSGIREYLYMGNLKMVAEMAKEWLE